MIELNKENFEKEVSDFKEKPVFIDFWGEKCAPCIALMPEVHKLEDKYSDKVKFCSLNTSKNRRLAIKERVLGLPTMAIYKDGKKIEALTPDKVTIESIEEMLKKY
ncbi:MAG: thioredoxin domain-containing protein [Clostridiales bacterium]|nr:thioredoxin domain-containing protein [Clostridiales bacterium]HBM80630.1 thiol reductase thioredoxin [Clostridiaceae bacterium]